MIDAYFRMMMISLSLIAVTVPLIFSARILWMIDSAARRQRQPVKVYLVDFFSLLFLVQLPYAIFFQFYRNDTEDWLMVSFAATIFAVVMLMVWWTTIRTVSRAGISSTAARSWISLLVIPMTYVGSFAIVGFGFTLTGRIAEQRESFIPLLAFVLVLIALLVFAFFVTRRIIKQTQEPVLAEEVEEPFSDSFDH